MTVSTVGVADADTPDKYLHTNQRTISSTAREDQYVLQGEGAYPTYSVAATGLSITTAASHVLQIMGDGSNYSRLRRITVGVWTPAVGSATDFHLFRLSTAGTGGTAKTPAPFDTADTYGGGAMTLPSSKGTEGALLAVLGVLHFDSSANNGSYKSLTWEARPGDKPIIFGTATSSGIALKSITGIAASVWVHAEFVVTSYL